MYFSLSNLRNAFTSMKPFLAGIFLLTAVVSAQTVKVSFLELEKTATEGDSVDIVVTLSDRSWFEAEVTYSVDESSTAVEGEDFEIVTPPDSEEPENPLIFRQGVTQRIIRLNILNDLLDESGAPETLILNLEGQLIVNGEPAELEVTEPSQFTLNIEDSGNLSVRFGEFTQVVSEGEVFELPLILSDFFEGSVDVEFSITSGTASVANDLDLSSGQTTRSPFTVSGISQFGQISISTANDSIEEADLEDFRVTLNSAKVTGEDTAVDVDPRHFIGYIRDTDPLEVNFVPFDRSFQLELPERTNLNLVVELSGPTPQELQVPFTLSGSAEKGTGGEADFDMDESPLIIPEGAVNLTFPIRLRNNSVPDEDPRNLIITLGTPTLADGTPQTLGPNNQFEVIIVEDEPLTLNFGRFVEAGTGGRDDVYEAETRRIIGESDGSFRLPIFLSERVTSDVTFNVQIVGSQTTARAVDPTEFRDQQEWDYQASRGGAFRVDPDVPTEFTIPTGQKAVFLDFAINDDEEPVVKPGEPLPDDFEEDEVITVRINQLDTDDQLLELGEASEYELVIRDFPNYDISSQFNTLEPSGTPTFNPISGLYEVPYELALTEPLDESFFKGYRSLRFEFSSAEVDRENPNLENRITDPRDPRAGQEFIYVYPGGHRLAYRSDTENEILIPGEPRDQGDAFKEVNADTVVRYDLIRRNINLPPVNEQDSLITEYTDPQDPMSLLFEFTNLGSTSFDLNSILPSTNPESFRITISRELEAAESFTSQPLYLSPKRVFRDAAGNTVINIRIPPDVAANTSGIQIDYWDGEGEWKTMSPALIEFRGNEFFFIDNGPPKSDIPSSDAPFRLYRIFQRQ